MFLEAHQSQLPTATRIYPDEFHPGENPFKGPALWERTPDAPKIATTLETKLGFGYDVLKEVAILRKSLETYGYYTQESQGYALENEFTAACEAVQDSGYYWSNHRQWDNERGEFLAFGSSFLELLESGAEDMRRKIVNGKPEYQFELDRRSTELNNERELRKLAQEDNSLNDVLFTVSAYPEEQPAEIAQELGYKPKEQLAKLRFEVFRDGVRQTVEIAVKHSSVSSFQKLYTNLGHSGVPISTSTALLGTRISLGHSDNYLDTITGVIAEYDEVLKQEHGSDFFCGDKIAPAEGRNYEQIIERQKWVLERGKPFIQHIDTINKLLAEGLFTQELPSELAETMSYWLGAQNNTQHILSRDEHIALFQSLQANSLSPDAAFSIKKNELIRMWSILSCVINESHAKKLFGEEAVKNMQSFINENSTSFDPQLFMLADTIASQANTQFILCGGAIGGDSLTSTNANLFQNSLGGVQTILFDSLFEGILKSTRGIGKEACVRCPECGNEDNNTQLKDGSYICGRESCDTNN